MGKLSPLSRVTVRSFDRMVSLSFPLLKEDVQVVVTEAGTIE
jgi:hypothetical protein